MGPKNGKLKKSDDMKNNFYILKITKYRCSTLIHSRRNSLSYLRVYNTTLLSRMSALALTLFWYII